MSEKKYIHRLFDEILERHLKSASVIIVEGPKWCGKSRTSKRHAKTIIDLMPTDKRKNYVEFARVSPHDFLNIGGKPVLIDEWQHISFISDDIKAEVDNNYGFGQYILTGSVSDKTLKDNTETKDRHTGSGRMIKLEMKPMSLYESGESNGLVSITSIKNGKFKSCTCDKTLNDYAFYICRGGWPLAINEPYDIALKQVKNYFSVLVSEDIFSIKNIPLIKNESKAKQVIRSYSRHIAYSANDQALLDDCVSPLNAFDKETFYKYISALKFLYVIDEVPAWNPFLRSKVAIREKPTRHFVDPSIAATSLGISPKNIFNDITMFGLLFESLVIRDLKIYSSYLDASLYKYRDSKGNEADAVIEFGDGTFALIEVKLGDINSVNEAAENLIKISDMIDKDKTGKLSFLMVVTKGNLAYKREDGVYVVPLACLKP